MKFHVAVSVLSVVMAVSSVEASEDWYVYGGAGFSFPLDSDVEYSRTGKRYSGTMEFERGRFFEIEAGKYFGDNFSLDVSAFVLWAKGNNGGSGYIGPGYENGRFRLHGITVGPSGYVKTGRWTAYTGFGLGFSYTENHDVGNDRNTSNRSMGSSVDPVFRFKSGVMYDVWNNLKAEFRFSVYYSPVDVENSKNIDLVVPVVSLGIRW